MKTITAQWIEFARADIDAAKVQLQHGARKGSAYQVVIFHCHQAIEKLLKAHLVEQDKEAKKTHDLTALRTMAQLQMPEAMIMIIDELQPHYLIPRYPDLPFSPEFSFRYNRKNAEEILRKTHDAFIWLEHALKQKK